VKFKVQQLITAQNLKYIGFTSKSYINETINDIEDDFTTHVNITLQHYYRDKNLTTISNKKLSDAADALLALISTNEYEANVFKADAIHNLKKSNINIDNNTLHFEALAPAPINTHSKKLQLINAELRKHKQGLFGGGNEMSIESIFHQLTILQTAIKNLSESNNEFKILEDKKSKAKLELKLIQSLYVNWKIFTGARVSLYTTDAIDDSISGEFFNLVKLCFIQEGQVLSDGSIKIKISKARLQ
jgi:hypothetical protein